MRLDLIEDIKKNIDKIEAGYTLEINEKRYIGYLTDYAFVGEFFESIGENTNIGLKVYKTKTTLTSFHFLEKPYIHTINTENLILFQDFKLDITPNFCATLKFETQLLSIVLYNEYYVFKFDRPNIENLTTTNEILSLDSMTFKMFYIWSQYLRISKDKKVNCSIFKTHVVFNTDRSIIMLKLNTKELVQVYDNLNNIEIKTLSGYSIQTLEFLTILNKLHKIAKECPIEDLRDVININIENSEIKLEVYDKSLDLYSEMLKYNNTIEKNNNSIYISLSRLIYLCNLISKLCITEIEYLPSLLSIPNCLVIFSKTLIILTPQILLNLNA